MLESYYTSLLNKMISLVHKLRPWNKLHAALVYWEKNNQLTPLIINSMISKLQTAQCVLHDQLYMPIFSSMHWYIRLYKNDMFRIELNLYLLKSITVMGDTKYHVHVNILEKS